MAEERQCSECGSELPADAPQGLCPQCLIKLGLPTGADIGKTATPDNQSGAPTNQTPPGRFVPPEPTELAKQFPQLEILELLGQGGMGAVYKARQKQLDRVVALKILPPEVGQDTAFTERFMREARSMAKLNNPRIVSVFDFGQTKENLYYFIMEFVDGTDLRHVIQAGGLSPKEALALVPQICEALQFAHEEGIVHRDIKPENILIDKKGRVRISDFGLAKLLDKPATAYTLTAAGHTMGTPHYMAPEQIEGAHEVDHRADIYSLGVVFYEMLTGQLPIGQFAPPSQKVQVDVRLDKVVLKSLAHEPERRYQHASEVKTDVEQISAGTEPPRPAVEAIQEVDIQAVRRKVRRPAIAMLIAGIITLASGPITGLWILAEYRLVDSWEVADWRLGTTVLTIWLIVQVVAVIPAALVIAAALNMKRLQSRGLTLAAAILAMIPLTFAWLFSLPIAIWVLSVISRSEVKAAFPQRPIDLSKQGKWNGFCIAALLISLVGGLMSIREIDPGDEVRDRIIWGAAIVLSSVFACIGLWQHAKYRGMHSKSLGIAALVIALAALISFFVTIYYPVT